MSTRIAALWKKTRPDGSTYYAGSLNCDAGINIPAGSDIGFSLEQNTTKTEGDKKPDMFVTVYQHKDTQA